MHAGYRDGSCGGGDDDGDDDDNEDVCGGGGKHCAISNSYFRNTLIRNKKSIFMIPIIFNRKSTNIKIEDFKSKIISKANTFRVHMSTLYSDLKLVTDLTAHRCSTRTGWKLLYDDQ